ncbi:TLC domain-containing protein 2-like [Saccostrea echinata]|uniref:TLC domain-containing protein 2-like n=1 Tax=Saccostrea echinata TaxID=191078 RepID=UPI002A806B7C|nr:TLC domain-containing protein 2-like [Saccostrea echinata]
MSYAMASSYEKDDANDVDRRFAILMIVVSVTFFYLLNMMTAKFIKPPPSASKDPWRWRNLFVSWIHAILCGSWDLACFSVYPEMFNDLVAHINYFTYMMVAFSTGYFIYDALDMYLNNKLLSDWGVTLHHIIVILFFIHTILTKYGTGLTCVALMTEINGVFLHARKLMQMFQFGFNHKLYILNKYMNLSTFIICRGFPIIRIFYGLLYECHEIVLPLRITFKFMVILMAVINIVLFKRLCKSDVLIYFMSKHKQVNGDENNYSYKKK